MISYRKPLIFVTNDDGYQSKGIQELVKVLQELGEVVVIAPDGPRSGMSSAISSIDPIRINMVKKEENLTVYRCTGTPVDCVKLGINEILDRKPDLLVSGINHGSNAAVCVIYSGTIGATLEGCIFGIPSLGVSLTNHDHDADFAEAARYGKLIAGKVLEEGLPKGICLNLNVPDIDHVKGLKICSQTKGYWAKEFMPAKDASGKTVYWLTGSFYNEDPENDCNDEWALANGFAALVPIQVDMTAHHFLDDIRHWEG